MVCVYSACIFNACISSEYCFILCCLCIFFCVRVYGVFLIISCLLAVIIIIIISLLHVYVRVPYCVYCCYHVLVALLFCI